MLSKALLNGRYQKKPCENVRQKKYRKKRLPKTPVKIHYQNNCIDMLVIMVPDKIDVKNTARTSLPKTYRIETVLGKVVSEIGAQKTFEESQSKHDGIEKLVNKKFENDSQNTVKKPHSLKGSI